MWLLEGHAPPDHNTIARFRTMRVKDSLEDLFFQFIGGLLKAGELDLANIFVDGTKIEGRVDGIRHPDHQEDRPGDDADGHGDIPHFPLPLFLPVKQVQVPPEVGIPPGDGHRPPHGNLDRHVQYRRAFPHALLL